MLSDAYENICATWPVQKEQMNLRKWVSEYFTN